MKILKQLSSFFFVFLVCNPINNIKANEPVDIWNIEKKENVENLKNEIYKFTNEENFKKCKSMGELMEQTLDYLKRNYQNVSLIDLI